jgi:hypothetical protein
MRHKPEIMNYRYYSNFPGMQMPEIMNYRYYSNFPGLIFIQTPERLESLFSQGRGDG